MDEAMRILGFEKIDWPNHVTRQRSKLLAPTFTTWRFPRKDADRGRDWAVGETVQIVIKPRSPDRLVLGHALIIESEARGYSSFQISDDEARQDGFVKSSDLDLYLTRERYKRRLPYDMKANKLTLEWRLWLPAMIKYVDRGGIYR
jgi:hypothetical protein